jgi:hypothetical protein
LVSIPLTGFIALVSVMMISALHKVANGWKLREAISLAPWLQPGDPWDVISPANRFNGFPRPRNR